LFFCEADCEGKIETSEKTARKSIWEILWDWKHWDSSWPEGHHSLDSQDAWVVIM